MEGENFSFIQRKLLKEVAGHPVPMLNFFKRGLILEAVFAAMLAAASKGTARRQIQRTGNFTRQSLYLFTGTEINLKDSLHQGLGIGMLAAFGNTSVLKPFHYIAQIHHCYLMAH